MTIAVAVGAVIGATMMGLCLSLWRGGQDPFCVVVVLCDVYPAANGFDSASTAAEAMLLGSNAGGPWIRQPNPSFGSPTTASTQWEPDNTTSEALYRYRNAADTRTVYIRVRSIGSDMYRVQMEQGK